MSQQSFPRVASRILAVVALALGLGALLTALPARGLADEPRTGAPGGRAVVAKCVTATGSILRREAEGKPWQLVKEGEDLCAGDLLLGLPGAALDSANGAVRLTFRADLAGASPLPIVETALVLQEGKGVDLDFFLERGRVDVANQKKKGEAHVRGHIRKDAPGEVVLAEPGAEVTLLTYGWWPAGVPFTKGPKAGDEPTKSYVFLVLKGHADVKVGNRQFAMSAPKGPALVQGNTRSGDDFTPERLDVLPDWAKESDSEEAKQRKANLEQFRKLIVAKSLDAAVDELLASDDPRKRRLAVVVLGAIDDLPRLGNALAATKHRDVWDNGVLVLRHWIGRGPGQDQKLYSALRKDKNYTEVEAETVLQLLHSFAEEEVGRPELYETLIDYLEHDKLAIRGLSHWHLVRLVPEGKKIPYDPLGAKEARAKAVAEWQKLVPPGKLPPKGKKDDK